MTHEQNDHVRRMARLEAELDLETTSCFDLERRSDEIRKRVTSRSEKVRDQVSLQRDSSRLAAGQARQSAALKMHAEDLKQLVQSTKEGLKYAADTATSTGRISRNLRAAASQFEEARQTMKELMDIDGPVQSLEICSLKESLTKATDQIDKLRGQADALQTLLLNSASSRTSKTAAIKGFDAPPLTLDPLQRTNEVILNAVKHLTAENQNLRQLLDESNRTHQDQARELTMMRTQQRWYEQQREENKQLLDNVKTGTEGALEVFRRAAEQKAVKDLEQKVNALQLENDQNIERAEAAKTEEDSLRTRVHWLENDMIAQNAKAAGTKQSILEVLNTERSKRAAMVSEQTVIHRLKEEAACSARDLAVAQATTAEQVAKDAQAHAEGLEKKVAELNDQMTTASKLFGQKLEDVTNSGAEKLEIARNAHAAELQSVRNAHAAELQSVRESSERGMDELKKSGDVSKTSAEAFASRLADETLQNKVNAAEQIAATADQKRIVAETNATTADKKRIVAEGKIEVAELRATAAEKTIKGLEEQLELSKEATKSAQAHQTDAVQNSKKAVDEVEEIVKNARESRELSEQVQRELMRNTSQANDLVDELKDKVSRQKEELADMSRLQDELATIKTELGANKVSLEDFRRAHKKRGELRDQDQQRIRLLEQVIADKDRIQKGPYAK
jgi:hypothetical protein